MSLWKRSWEHAHAGIIAVDTYPQKPDLVSVFPYSLLSSTYHRIHEYSPRPIIIYTMINHLVFSTNHHGPLLREVVLRNLEVQRRRSLSSSAGHIVMRAVARAKPSTKIAGLANGNAAQVGAHADHDEPFGLLDAVFVFLGVAEDGDAGQVLDVVQEHGDVLDGGWTGLDWMYLLYAFGILDFIFCSVSDEHWLATPFDDHVLAERNGR